MRSHMIYTWQHARLDTDGGKRGAASWPAQTSGRRNHHSDERWLPHCLAQDKRRKRTRFPRRVVKFIVAAMECHGGRLAKCHED